MISSTENRHVMCETLLHNVTIKVVVYNDTVTYCGAHLFKTPYTLSGT